MKNCKTLLLFIGFLTAVFTGCDKEREPEPELTKPTISEVEIGLGNNEIGVIGKDFHFNAEVLAGDKIENVQVKIVPQSDETYEKAWEFEVTWEQYRGAKNATVHKHFDIPEEAAEGKYDFLIIVNDQNGTMLEEKREINIYKAENLPVNPTLSLLTINNNGTFFYRNGEFTVDPAKVSKDDKFSAQATIDGVKGDGQMYLLLINKKLQHRPESIDQIDFEKAIVLDVYEHKDWEEGGSFSNAVFDENTFTWVRRISQLDIGAANDNNASEANPIDGAKSWESGTYYFGVLYKNTTYNMSYFEYLEFGVDGF